MRVGQCFGIPNVAYPIVLVIGMIGIELVFFGLFGRIFVSSLFSNLFRQEFNYSTSQLRQHGRKDQRGRH